MNDKGKNKKIMNSTLIPHYGDPLANADLALKEYKKGLTKLSTLPPIVTFALTTHCFKNKPCVICDRNTRPESANSEVDATIVAAVKPLLKTAVLVFLHCGGEALFSSYFDEVVASITPPTKIHFSTNGMALTQSRSEQMLKSGVMTHITVSMDAATPETYQVMRPSCDFDLVKRNLVYYGRLGKQLFGKDAPGIILNMTLCEANIKEVSLFVDLAMEIGAVGIIYNHLNSGQTHEIETSEGWTWDYKEQENFRSKKQHDTLILKAYQHAKDNGIRIAFIGEPFLTSEMALQNKDIKSDLNNYSWIVPEPIWINPWVSPVHNPLKSDLKTCLKAWQEIAIQPNGNVRRCYFHDEQQWTLGNICETDFMELWNSEEMITYRSEFLDNSMSDICFSSTPCMYRGRI